MGKLTEPQMTALQQFDWDGHLVRWMGALSARTNTLQALERKGLIRWEDLDNEDYGAWWLTDAGRDALRDA